MKVRPREAADRVAAWTFLACHHSARVARLGELLDPLDHPALLAEADDGRLLGMLTYVPERGWEQCEVPTLHASEQWHGVGTALIEGVEQLAAQHGCARSPGLGLLPGRRRGAARPRAGQADDGSLRRLGLVTGNP